MHQETVYLAVDMMSGDSNLRASLPAALETLQEFPQLKLHLIGDGALLSAATNFWPVDIQDRMCIVDAPEGVASDIPPIKVLEKQYSSSMSVALELLVAGTVSGIVSACNAGALMVLARKLLGSLVASTRPALCSLFPTRRGACLILDLGANVDCPAAQLHYFGLIGAALHNALHAGAEAKVALLSNGVERSKGNSEVRKAAKLLEASSSLHFVGYEEADNLHTSIADVIVCDGFVGNIALKAVEGTAAHAYRHFTALLDAEVEDDNLRRTLRDGFLLGMDPDLHNGAFLLGLPAVVIKAHGNSSPKAFAASIGQALTCVEQGMIEKMKAQLIGEQLAGSSTGIL